MRAGADFLASNRHLLLVVDKASRFPFAPHPLMSKHAEEVARDLMQLYDCRSDFFTPFAVMEVVSLKPSAFSTSASDCESISRTDPLTIPKIKAP